MPEVRLHGGPADGLALHYLVEGRGPTILLIHGLGGFGASWRRTTEALAERGTVYAVDLPGFGLSAKPRTRYGLEFFADALHGFMAALGLGQISLVGHSLGGAVALTYALKHPTRVHRLALLSALVPGFAYRLAPPLRVLAVRGVGEALALGGCRPIYRAALARCFHRPVNEDIDFLIDCDYGARTAWDARLAYLTTLRGVRTEFEHRGQAYRRALATLDLPVLLIHGRQDRVVPATHGAEIAGALPRAVTRWLEACGHFPQIEHANVVNDWLGEFLVGRRAPR